MSFSLPDKVVKSLVGSDIIRDEDKELYTYGLTQGFFILLNLVTSLVIGLIFNMLWQSILFSLAYLPLRSNAGGYHARTQSRCYIFSIFLIIAALLAIKHIPRNIIICIISIICSSAIVAVLSPVEDENKPLDKKERAVYKRRACIMLAVLVCLAIIFWMFGANEISICIIVALLAMSMMLVLGIIKG